MLRQRLSRQFSPHQRSERRTVTDYSTPNLPSADFDRTEQFYTALGFETHFRNPGWMILKRGTLALEFFPGDIDPKTSWFSACLRVDDLDGLHADFSKAGLSHHPKDRPRLEGIKTEPVGIRIFYMLDPDGSLIRCLDNTYTP